MRLALLLFLAVAAFAATVEETCQRGQFLSSTGECEDCRECGKYMYTRKQCTQNTNTVCGWCGSKTIVQTEDFETKCEPWKKDFDMLGQLKLRIQKQMEKKMMGEDEDVIIKDLDGETHIVEIKSKKHRNELDDDLPELPMPDNWEKEQELEYDSEEYDYDEEGLDEISLEQMRKELDRDMSLPKPVVPSKHIMEKSNPVKVMPMIDIERMHTSEEIEEQIKAMQVDERDIGEEDSDESEQGEVIEIVNPRAEIARLPMRIIVTADRDEDSYEDENIDNAFVEEEEGSLSRRNIRILYRIIFIWLLILIVFAVLRCYLASKRAARYHFVMLPQQGMTREQEEMINRCAEKLHKKKVSKEAHCYENQIAYV